MIMKMQPTPIDERGRANMAAFAASREKQRQKEIERTAAKRDNENPFVSLDLPAMTALYRSNPSLAREMAARAGVTLPE
jgi:hypothetical protein